ncbi:MAG: hypothetical protein HYX24_03945 [Candidatus Aenigmarchaeota archaeon]|nr:hypothetical protein [Candidatus Aenigmarchaeota archaeon]
MKMKPAFAAILILVSVLTLGYAHSQYSDDSINADHIQPGVDPSVVPPSLRSVKIGESSSWEDSDLDSIGVQAYSNPKIYLRSNEGKGEYSLGSDDTLCLGKTYELADADMAGEWEPKGGPEDSPPIEFVPSLDDAKRQIESNAFSAATYPAAICAWPARDTKEGPERCHFDIAVVCEKKCSLNSEGVIRDGSSFTVRQQGPVNVEYSCNADCMLFLKRGENYPNPYYAKFGGYGSPTLPPVYGYAGLSPGKLKTHAAFSLQTVPQRGASLKIVSMHMPEETAEKAVSRVVIENEGDDCAWLEDINFNVQGHVLYSPKGKICSGQTAEILFEADRDDLANAGSLSLNLKYEAETLGCDKTKNKEASFKSGKEKSNVKSGGGSPACSSDSDCSTGEECCVNICRPAAEGVCDDIDSDGILDTWVPIRK